MVHSEATEQLLVKHIPTVGSCFSVRIMALKHFLILALAFTLALAAPKKSSNSKQVADDDGGNKQVAALLVKDNENGEMRFLTGTGTGSGNGGINSALNQYITQKQNLLEQLRPTGSGTGSFTSGFGTGTGSFTSGTGTGSFISGSGSSNGVTPIVISLGGNGGSGGNGGVNSAIVGASPITGLLPQIVANGVLGTRGNRRRGNRRRVANRRRGSASRRRRPQGGVYVVRPKY